MAQRKFGGRGSTDVKLDIINTYLQMYQKALGGRFKTIYFDAFAGSGEVPLGNQEPSLISENFDTETALIGSAVLATQVEPRFSHYIFVDKRPQCIDSLRSKFADLSDHDIRYATEDANLAVRRLCDGVDWRSHRAVVFLDPFGSQVEWETLQAIASTKAIDVWYLFPAGNSVFRQISKSGKVHWTHEPSITRIYGTDAWKEEFLSEETAPSLFGMEKITQRDVTPLKAADFMLKRMKSIFEGGVLDKIIPLGQHSYPSFYLLFAWGNPSKPARVLADRLANAAISATEKQYGRLL